MNVRKGVHGGLLSQFLRHFQRIQSTVRITQYLTSLLDLILGESKIIDTSLFCSTHTDGSTHAWRRWGRCSISCCRYGLPPIRWHGSPQPWLSCCDEADSSVFPIQACRPRRCTFQKAQMRSWSVDERTLTSIHFGSTRLLHSHSPWQNNFIDVVDGSEPT